MNRWPSKNQEEPKPNSIWQGLKNRRREDRDAQEFYIYAIEHCSTGEGIIRKWLLKSYAATQAGAGIRSEPERWRLLRPHPFPSSSSCASGWKGRRAITVNDTQNTTAKRIDSHFPVPSQEGTFPRPHETDSGGVGQPFLDGAAAAVTAGEQQEAATALRWWW